MTGRLIVWMVWAFIATPLIFEGCNNSQSNSPATIALGMPISDARREMSKVGATETRLAMSPPINADGQYLGLESYMVGQNKVLTIIFDKPDTGRITSMSLCSNVDRPKLETEWIPIESYSLTGR